MPEPLVQVGDTWRSNDPRDNGRTVTVIDIDARYAYVRNVRRSRILLARFHAPGGPPRRSGYSLLARKETP